MRVSPAQRARRLSLRIGALLSTVAFIWIGPPVLMDQWIEGYASAGFMFGTACLVLGASLALFGIIVGLGFVIASALSEEQSGRE